MLTKCMKQSRAKGFTLTEVVLAIGVVAVLIAEFSKFRRQGVDLSLIHILYFSILFRHPYPFVALSGMVTNK